jgi:hypothetical protein
MYFAFVIFLVIRKLLTAHNCDGLKSDKCIHVSCIYYHPWEYEYKDEIM